MARMNRLKARDRECWYHLYNRTAGEPDYYPLDKLLSKRKLTDMLKRYASAFCCRVATFNMLGNHYHIILKMEKPRKLARSELRRRALILYSETYIETHFHTPEDWDDFERRLFDLSKLMHVLDGEYVRWYNKTHGRRGRFWASRFNSLILHSLKAVRDCMIYVDLNSVRAKLVQRPEEYEESGIYLRQMGGADWLTGLNEIFGGTKSEYKQLKDYKFRLYHRGGVAPGKGQAKIPQRILKQEAAAGFGAAGAYLRRFTYFVRGVILGPWDFILQELENRFAQGLYKLPRIPIQPEESSHFILHKPRAVG